MEDRGCSCRQVKDPSPSSGVAMSLIHSCPVCQAPLPEGSGPCPACANLAGGVRGDAWWTGPDKSTLVRPAPAAVVSAVNAAHAPVESATLLAQPAEPPKEEMPEGAIPW